ncbi:helix-turn-helix domain-containing protein [Salmonella enterica subsp. enterica serovar Lubbock]|jgi:phage repressor protein C with HTH and peptisase S24 domain|uniref:Helix-turn-helix transcriptional regulator n=2 Tax=Enterobacteriaceae TaxID=543 RepID=A0ABR6RZC6_9ENTR|nr:MULTISPECIES: XRE family transcriptional regulator [Enterobacteriaceae]MDI4928431.1 helix-turn-helix domain-containing protein [Salmonella enterica subsp. enterica serovar Lubbock]MDK2553063.1 S24 family peptidase [Citrobacter youngae]KNI56628.1 ribonuclease BN [Salmonella enterica subsp. enterica serovar Thompson]KNI64974.1 ribonuclease BN [Salmonella enterica subsp. enterica serovar Thompson]KTI66939.1 ribonuclease BN [Enterobacter kobei]
MTELIVQSSTDIVELMVQQNEREKFSLRLALACDKAGLPQHGRQADLAARMKLTPKAVSKWFNGESVPRKEKMELLASVLGTTAAYLHGYATEDGITPNHASKVSDSYRVDVLDVQASAGPGTMISNEFIEKVRAIEYTTEHARTLFNGRPQDHIKVITVSGDSMEGTINPGDEIFVDVSVNHFDADGIYVFVYGRTLHVKRLQMQKDKLVVISDNPIYERWHIEEADEDQLHVVAKVLLRQSIDYRRFG